MSTAALGSRACDRRSPLTYDYIITGGGPAGCVLAQPAERGSGASRCCCSRPAARDRHPYFHMPAGFAKMTKGIASWGWSTVPQQHLNGRVLWYTQAKVIGGGSSINAQVYTRGNAARLRRLGHEEGCTGWSYARGAALLQARGGQPALRRRVSRLWRPARRLVPVNPLPISEAFLRAARSTASPTTPTSTARSRTGSATTR